MRTLSEYLSGFPKIKFTVSWRSDSDIFEVIAYSKRLKYRFRGFEDQAEIVNMINQYYRNSGSVNKTLKYINKFADPISEPIIKSKKNVFACPSCGHQEESPDFDISGTKCPRCDDDYLEKLSN